MAAVGGAARAASAARTTHGLHGPQDPPAGHKHQQVPPGGRQGGRGRGQDQDDEEQLDRGEALDRVPRPCGQPQRHRPGQGRGAHGRPGRPPDAQPGRPGDPQAGEGHQRRRGQAGGRPPRQVAPQGHLGDRQGHPDPVLLLLQEHKAHHDADQHGHDDGEGNGPQLREPGPDHDAVALQRTGQPQQARPHGHGHDQWKSRHPRQEPVAPQPAAVGVHQGQYGPRRH